MPVVGANEQWDRIHKEGMHDLLGVDVDLALVAGYMERNAAKNDGRRFAQLNPDEVER
jgi:hypothetical protein